VTQSSRQKSDIRHSRSFVRKDETLQKALDWEKRQDTGEHIKMAFRGKIELLRNGLNRSTLYQLW
jgi:hypothetical protein